MGRKGHAVCIIGHVQAMPDSIHRNTLGSDVLFFSRQNSIRCFSPEMGVEDVRWIRRTDIDDEWS
ncbi:uncharacterized protein Bfra_009541 [Botrytis fragariae]|uniref:Uncharacterized protein n=1 Tax=Botrytis fragariae TaxID=1964551 RepID=A0A8H6AP15_9HELO|nr:uncharacterized protein Bfra_009541 [Botrytis fragariae]KAF5870987.1 hypothetical protein Bfra_009541 [Botrytis fragariae]